MTTISDNAVCLRRWDFSETSQTVSLFTAEYGLLRGLAKGAKRPKSRFSGGFDLLTRGQVVAILKSGRNLANIIEWHLETVYTAPRRRLACNRIGLYIAELVMHMFDELDPHPKLFQSLIDVLDAMESAAQPDPHLLVFQLDLLREAGFAPMLDSDAETGQKLDEKVKTLAFSPGAGGVVADTGGSDRWRVRRETIDLLRQARDDRNAFLTAAAASQITTTGVHRANRLLATYLREQIGRDTPAMHWAFPDLPEPAVTRKAARRR